MMATITLPSACLPPLEPSTGAVLSEVARAWSVSVEAILGQSRARKVNLARRAAIVALYRLKPTATMREIGEAINRDHTTALHHLRVAGIYTADRELHMQS